MSSLIRHIYLPGAGGTLCGLTIPLGAGLMQLHAEPCTTCRDSWIASSRPTNVELVDL